MKQQRRIEVKLLEKEPIHTRSLAEFFAQKIQREALGYEHRFTENS